MEKLSENERAFILAYVKSGNAIKSAKGASIPPEQALLLLKEQRIQDALAFVQRVTETKDLLDIRDAIRSLESMFKFSPMSMFKKNNLNQLELDTDAALKAGNSIKAVTVTDTEMGQKLSFQFVDTLNVFDKLAKVKSWYAPVKSETNTHISHGLDDKTLEMLNGPKLSDMINVTPSNDTQQIETTSPQFANSKQLPDEIKNLDLSEEEEEEMRRMFE